MHSEPEESDAPPQLHMPLSEPEDLDELPMLQMSDVESEPIVVSESEAEEDIDDEWFGQIFRKVQEESPPRPRLHTAIVHMSAKLSLSRQSA